MENNKKILVVDKLNKYFTKSGKLVKVLDSISFDVYEKDFLGIIGESGSGKSTTGKCIIRLYSSSSGNIIFDDVIINQNKINKKTKRWLYQNMSMIFQDPMSSLNGRKNILSIISEPLIINKTIQKEVKQLINQCRLINPFFQNTYKWQDYNLCKEYVVPFYEENIKNLKEGINTIQSLNVKTVESLNELKDILVDIESNYKATIKNLNQFANLIKLIHVYNYESFMKDELHVTEIEFRHANDSLNEEKKLQVAPEEYWKLSKQLEQLKQENDNYINETNLKFKQQTTSRIKSIKSRYISEIKSLKQNAALTESITENIQYKTDILILNDTLHAIKALGNEVFIDENEIEVFSNYINERIKYKYASLTQQIVELGKLSEEIDKLSLKDVPETLIREKFSAYKTLYDEVIQNQETLRDTDFLIEDPEVMSLIDAINIKSNEKKQEVKTKIHDYEMRIIRITNRMNVLKQEFAKEHESREKEYEAMHQEFEKAKIARETWQAEDNEFFNTQKLPLIQAQEALMEQQWEEFYELQKQLKAVVREKIKEAVQANKENKKDANDLNIIKREIKIKWLTIDAINFEVETIFDDITLYRKIRSTSKTVLYSQYKKLKNSLIRTYVYKALEEVGLKNEHAYRYPHEFSGGQRQRIVIARALISKPKLVIADEPISALDVSIQAQVINIMKSLANKYGITFLFIAHDLSMVRYTSNRLIILHKGKIVEKGDTNEVFSNPIHPYTKSLIKASPELSKIHVDLASFSSKLDYDKDYSPNNVPEFHKIPSEKEHYVYATKGQIKKWVK